MHEILTTEQIAEADRQAAALGVPSLTLMENAGRAVANEAAQLLSPGARVLVLCGPGNNGGDGFVAARYLKQRGFAVRLACLVPVVELKGDAATMAAKWMALDAVEAFPESTYPKHNSHVAALVRWPDMIIDAVFGAGLSRPLPRNVQDVFSAMLGERCIGHGVIKLAVDVPSGIDGNTGKTLQADYYTPFDADVSVTFARKKPAHALGGCGRVVLADIGIPDAAIAQARTSQTAPCLHENDPSLWMDLLRRLEPNGDRHKYHSGHVAVISGPAHRTGASRLAARAALRAGAGLVTVLSPLDAVATHAAHLTAVMIAPFDGPEGFKACLQDDRINSIVIGPALGLGEDARALVDVAIDAANQHRIVVLDADALTLLARDPSRLFERAKKLRQSSMDAWAPPPFVLTPHEGEFDRLFGKGKPGQSKIDRALEAAEISQCIVVFKGARTVIAMPRDDESSSPARAIVNTNAPSYLATAGTGDVLAGLIAGVSAGYSEPFEAAAAAVWMHGAGATLFGPGLIAEDLPETMPRVLSDLARRWATFRRAEEARLRAETRQP